MKKTENRYVVKSVVHAAQVLSAFESHGEVLRLQDLVERTQLSRGMCYRLLCTLDSCGFVEKVSPSQYRLCPDRRLSRSFRIGFACQRQQESSFSRAVLAGLTQASREARLELVVLDNRYNSKVALRNADQLIRERVDLAIEFQTDEAVAAEIASRYLALGIPLVAIDVPHPGATYFGADNHIAGSMAGRYLGRWAQKHWDGSADELLLVEETRAGTVTQVRVRGMLEGVRDTLGGARMPAVVAVEGDGQFGLALENVRKHLRASNARRILVAASNDPSALGSLRAFEEAGRSMHCAVVGHSAEPESRDEMRSPRTRLIASVGYFPEKYGEGLIRLALDILAHKPTPPACFIKHHLVTPENVDQFYPNDQLLHIAGSAS
jgi:ribose transport system substrate-binding protein